MNSGIGQMFPFPSIWGHWYDILDINPINPEIRDANTVDQGPEDQVRVQRM